MKGKLLTIALVLGLISLGGWQMISPVHAAQHQFQANYEHESSSKADNDRERNDSQREVETQHQSQNNHRHVSGSKTDNDREKNDGQRETEN